MSTSYAVWSHFQLSKVMLMAFWDSKKFAVDFVTTVIALLNQLRSYLIACFVEKREK